MVTATPHAGGRPSRPAPRYAALVLALTALALPACGDDEDRASDRDPTAATATTTTGPATTATTTPSAPTATATTPTDGIDPMEDAGTDPIVVRATNAETALLTQVRAARHEGYDRIVFEFQNAVPGYDVRYADGPVREDGSGRTIPVRGGQVLLVRMENALDADLEKEGAPRTYTGPARFSPGTPQVTELARAGGFEGVLTWAVGLQDRVGFRVSTLRDPPRVVIDVGNH